MEKYLAILKNEKVLDFFEVQMRFRKIKYEPIKSTQFWIWTDAKNVNELNRTFEWIAIIKIES